MTITPIEKRPIKPNSVKKTFWGRYLFFLLCLKLILKGLYQLIIVSPSDKKIRLHGTPDYINRHERLFHHEDPKYDRLPQLQVLLRDVGKKSTARLPSNEI